MRFFLFMISALLPVLGGLPAQAADERQVHSASPMQPLPELSPFEANPTFEDLKVTMASGKSHVFKVEVAREPVEVIYGLMYRRDLDRDAGMIFIFSDDQERAFWMKNTYISLDLLFINADGTIHHIHEKSVPESLTPLPSNGPVRAVLEISGGRAAELGIKPGDVLDSPALKAAVAHQEALKTGAAPAPEAAPEKPAAP